MNRNHISAALVLLLISPVTGAIGAEESLPFSRSAWIASYMDRVEFSGGVQPRGDWVAPAIEPVAALRPEADPDAKKTKKPRRVNDDLLVDQNHPQPGSQAEPYIHANPSNPMNLVAGWQENRFPDGGAQTLNVATSLDGGKTWIEQVLPGLTVFDGGPWERASDPWVEFGSDSRVYFVSLLFNETTPDNAIGVSRSLDGGLTWGNPVVVKRSVLDFNDKEALTVDTFPTSRYFGSVYVAWDINRTDATGAFTGSQDLLVARSTNDGRSYKSAKRVRRGPTNIGAVPQVGPDGTVYVVWAGARSGENTLFVYFSKSRNGGKRWSSPRIIEVLASIGVPNIRDGSILPSFAVDPSNGDLYVVWQDSRWTGVDQITMIHSRDGGANWSRPQRVSAAPGNAPTFTGSVAVNGQGQVAISYYSLENDPAREFLVDRYLRISTDGGQTFGRAIRASRKTFDIRFAAQANGFFLGDYVGLTGTEKKFHVLWVDTRRRSADLGSKQPDVWTAQTK